MGASGPAWPRHDPALQLSQLRSRPDTKRPPAEEDLVLLREVKGFNQFLADGSKPKNDTWRVGVMTCGPLSDSAEADYAGFHFGYTE